MPLMVGTLPFDMATKVKGLEADMLRALGNCRDKLAGGQANAALQRWFGDTSAPFAKEMREKIAKMRSVLNAQSIECTTDYQTGNAGNNAEATHFVGGIFSGTDRVDRMTSTLTSIKIGPNFLRLPRTAVGAAATWSDQDQLETLLHELSHFVWGTGDEPLDDGTTAYGGSAARTLVLQSVARAKNNAENWGLFIEELG